MTSLKLHAYQERGVEFAMAHEQCYLALDLGMGKTAIALTVIARTKVQAFVFAPLRTIYSTWPEEIEKWTPHLSYYICHGPEKSLYGLEHCDIVLMNYEGLKWFAGQKGKWKKRMLILDESSMCKSHSTARFKMLKRSLTLWLPRRICMSATPAPNSYGELWSQYYLLDKGARLGKNISAFRTEYCSSFSYPGMMFTQYKVRPDKVKEIRKRISNITFRLDAKDHLDMPEITYNSIKLKLTSPLAKRYKKFEQEFVDEVTDTEAPNMAMLSMKLRQFVQGGLYDEEKVWNRVHDLKINALKELIETSAGQPILCAIQFRGELAVLQKIYGKDLPVIAGGTAPGVAANYIKQWNRGEIPLLLCHPASLSHGVNLQAGGHIILWYGLTWSLEQYLQLNGRLYRQGQKNHVVIHHLVMEDTVDEAVLKALESKNTVQKDLLDYIKQHGGMLK